MRWVEDRPSGFKVQFSANIESGIGRSDRCQEGSRRSPERKPSAWPGIDGMLRRTNAIRACSNAQAAVRHRTDATGALLPARTVAQRGSAPRLRSRLG